MCTRSVFVVSEMLKKRDYVGARGNLQLHRCVIHAPFQTNSNFRKIQYRRLGHSATIEWKGTVNLSFIH